MIKVVAHLVLRHPWNKGRVEQYFEFLSSVHRIGCVWQTTFRKTVNLTKSAQAPGRSLAKNRTPVWRSSTRAFQVRWRDSELLPISHGHISERKGRPILRDPVHRRMISALDVKCTSTDDVSMHVHWWRVNSRQQVYYNSLFCCCWPENKPHRQQNGPSAIEARFVLWKRKQHLLQTALHVQWWNEFLVCHLCRRVENSISDDILSKQSCVLPLTLFGFFSADLHHAFHDDDQNVITNEVICRPAQVTNKNSVYHCTWSVACSQCRFRGEDRETPNEISASMTSCNGLARLRSLPS